jgi:hypothetical protein
MKSYATTPIWSCNKSIEAIFALSGINAANARGDDHADRGILAQLACEAF